MFFCNLSWSGHYNQSHYQFSLHPFLQSILRFPIDQMHTFLLLRSCESLPGIPTLICVDNPIAIYLLVFNLLNANVILITQLMCPNHALMGLIETKRLDILVLIWMHDEVLRANAGAHRTTDIIGRSLIVMDCHARFQGLIFFDRNIGYSGLWLDLCLLCFAYHLFREPWPATWRLRMRRRSFYMAEVTYLADAAL